MQKTTPDQNIAHREKWKMQKQHRTKKMLTGRNDCLQQNSHISLFPMCNFPFSGNIVPSVGIWPIYEEMSPAPYWDKCQSNIPIYHWYMINFTMNLKVFHWIEDFPDIIICDANSVSHLKLFWNSDNNFYFLVDKFNDNRAGPHVSFHTQWMEISSPKIMMMIMTMTTMAWMLNEHCSWWWWWWWWYPW